MQVSLSPRRAELRREVQRCEQSLQSLEEVAGYSRNRDWFEPALQSAGRKRNLCTAVAAAAAVGVAVGLAVPAVAIAAPFGLVVGLYAGIGLKSAFAEMRSIREAKEQNEQLVRMFDQHIAQARGRLEEAHRQLRAEGDEPAEAVQKLVQGLRQSTRVLEDSARVTFAGVSLKKRR